MSGVNKVDMSLDDIIKLNKRQKGSKPGRGKLKQNGIQRVKQFRTSLRGAKNVRGQGRGAARGQIRGKMRGQGRGIGRNQGQGITRGQGPRRGRGRLSRLSGVSPLNRAKDQSNAAFTKSRGRVTGIQTQKKLNLSKQRVQAVNALRKAKQQLAIIDAQSTNRQNTFNERRGLLTKTSQQAGRGRGRGGRGKLSRQNYNQNANTVDTQYYYSQGGARRGRGRGKIQRVGALRMDALSEAPNTFKKKRQWRRKSVEIGQDNDGIMTISLPNTDFQPVPVEKPKPKKSFSYNKQIFAQSGGNSSLSQRFQDSPGNQNDRQVFL